MRIEKRLPFGFKGEWGKLYKLYTFDENKENIVYQDNNYVDIGQDVQFKYVGDGQTKKNTEEPISNLVTEGEVRIAETTDAYFDVDTMQYECVVKEDDIVFVFGKFWIVEEVEERSIFTPTKQSFYNCHLKRIFDEMIREQ